MLRTGYWNDPQFEDGLGSESGWNMGRDGQVGASLQQVFLGSSHHGLKQFDACLGAFGSELVKAAEQQPGWKKDLGAEPDLGFPAG